MDNELAKNRIREFLSKFKVGVLSTIDTKKNAPESALVGFGHTNELELIFETSNTSRKYRNLQNNPYVSFVVGWDSDTGTLQYDGIAREISAEEAKEYSNLILAKKFISQLEERYFIVKPVWIRFLDTVGNPPQVYELYL